MPTTRATCRLLAATIVLAPASFSLAKDINVPPGHATISAALAGATAGDVLILAEGEYTDALTLPEGLTLRGVGPDKTILVPTSNVAIRIAGPKVIIADLAIRGKAGDAATPLPDQDATFRGVNSDLPVRIERVRFTNIREAVALMVAPLSDVLACEFIDCETGVRAIGEACPTIAGCAFSGGRMGIFSMEGSPYIRDNLFTDNNEAIRIVAGLSCMAIIRNNTFHNNQSAAITVMSRGDRAGLLTIRNNLFVNCPVAITAPPGDSPIITDSVIFASSENPIRSNTGEATRDLAANRITIADPKLTLDGFRATIVDASILTGKGARLAHEKPGAKGHIGPSAEPVFGVAATLDPAAYPVRWAEPVHTANSVSEQYQYMRAMGIRASRQGKIDTDAGPQDVHTRADGGKLAFDISRFFGEYAVEP